MAQNRALLVRKAFSLEWLTAAWLVIEAAVAIAAGIAAHSLILIAFGADSIIELLSAGVLLRRLDLELRRGQEFSEDAERRAAKIGAGLLIALIGYVVISAAWSLWRGEGQDFSIPGFVLAIVAIPLMYGLARAKRQIALAIDSKALRVDAAESIACAYLSAVVVIGLIAQWIIGAWWIDGLGALALVPFLAREAREAWETDRDSE